MMRWIALCSVTAAIVTAGIEAGREAVAQTPDPAAGPVVTSVKPKHGPTFGATRVTIEGQGFTGATEVDFGDTLGRKVKVVSETELRVTSPAHGPGTVHVVVATPAGRSPLNTADHYHYVVLYGGGTNHS